MSDNKETRFCKDCRHVFENVCGKYCGHPDAPRDPVDGKPNVYCSWERGEASCHKGKCGPYGVLWEAKEQAPAVEAGARGKRAALPEWFDAFLVNVCEIPDRNSPEGEPDAVVATLDELKSCALNAIEARAALARASEAAHTDDVAVDSFACAMKDKMAQARAKGRSGWEGMDTAELSRMLRAHVEKGDPRDVANFCMMLWHQDARIDRASEAAAGEPVAYVPVHPRTGPLWANTVPSLDSDRPAHYPVRALCYAAPQPASEPKKQNADGLLRRWYEGTCEGSIATSDARYSVVSDTAEYLSQPASEQQGNNFIGILTVKRFRGADSMVNTDFEYLGSLPDGSYRCYLHSAEQQAASDDRRDDEIGG